jgi:cyanate permease
MGYYAFKVVVTAGMVIAVSELSRRSAFWGGLLASLPIVSYFGILWLYAETGSAAKVSGLAHSVFWLVLPSLPFFLLLPWLLSRQVRFVPSLVLATAVMIGLYLGMVTLLRRCGITL